MLAVPPVAEFDALDVLPPAEPPVAELLDVTPPPVWLPDADGLPPSAEQLPPLLQVSAELCELPLVLLFELRAFPPFPEASPATAVPPFALAVPPVAVAPLWSTEAFWVPLTFT